MKYRIGMLWIGGALGWLEKMCIQSYLKVGYDVDLYHYDDVFNVPDGVNLMDAREILDDGKIYINYYTGSPALHADKFRYRLLAARDDIIWSDMDAYCLREYKDNNGYILSWGTKGMVFIGVMRIPSSSLALNDIIKFTESEYPIPPWETRKRKRYLAFRKRLGCPVHVGMQRWTVWGSRSLTYYMKKYGEDEFVMDENVLYPISALNKECIFDENFDFYNIIEDESVYSIHLYGSWMRRYIHEIGFNIPNNSLLNYLLKREGLVVDREMYQPPSMAGRIIKKIRKKMMI